MNKRKVWMVASIAAVLAGVGSLRAQDRLPVAPATSDGKTLVVPQAHRSLGTPYYVISGRDRQIYFESDAPLEDIKGQSNRVIGYAVVSGGEPPSLAAGEWHLPVRSLRTGIELRDEHLAGPDWLDAKAYPDIIVQLRSLRDVQRMESTDAFSTYRGTMVVELTMHGMTRTVEIPGATFTLLRQSPATARIAPGNLMAIRAKFAVRLSDYGVSHPVIGNKVANEVAVEVTLYLSDRPPAAG